MRRIISVAILLAATIAFPTVGDVLSPPAVAAPPKPTLADQLINVREERFAGGAKGDGVTDDTAAFSAAIEFINSVNSSRVEANNVVGSTLFVPDGRYRIRGPVAPITKSGCNVVGASENGAVLILEADAATFRFGDENSDSIVGGGFSNLKFEYLGPPPPKAVVFAVQNAFRLRFSNLLLVNIGQLADLGASSTRQAGGVAFDAVRGYGHNSGRPMWSANYGAGLAISNAGVFVGGVIAPEATRTSTMSTSAGTSAIRLGRGSWDSVQITGSFFERFWRGLDVTTPNGVIVNNVFISNTYFDYIKDHAINLEARGTSAGGIFGFNVVNSWLASWEGDGIAVVGPGLIRGHTFASNRFASAGGASIRVTTGRDITIANNHLFGASRSIESRANALELLGGSHFIITGNNIGADTAWSGFPWQPPYGVHVAGNLDFISATDNIAAGAIAGWLVGSNDSLSKNRLVHRNLNASYAGDRTGQDIFTLPPSGQPFRNTTPHFVEMSLNGGHGTHVTRDGTKLFTGASGSILIGPGETVSIEYFEPPKVVYVVRN